MRCPFAVLYELFRLFFSRTELLKCWKAAADLKSSHPASIRHAENLALKSLAQHHTQLDKSQAACKYVVSYALRRSGCMHGREVPSVARLAASLSQDSKICQLAAVSMRWVPHHVVPASGSVCVCLVPERIHTCRSNVPACLLPTCA